MELKDFEHIDDAIKFMRDNGYEFIKAYKGKDNHCRCGCGGKYYYPEHKSFERILKNANKALHNLIEYGDEFIINRDYFFSDATKEVEGYINIPIFNDFNPRNFNQCYCLYFIKK